MKTTMDDGKSFKRREPWVSVVTGHGSSCLGAGLNNTVCLHKVGVGVASHTVCIATMMTAWNGSLATSCFSLCNSL